MRRREFITIVGGAAVAWPLAAARARNRGPAPAHRQCWSRGASSAVPIRFVDGLFGTACAGSATRKGGDILSRNSLGRRKQTKPLVGLAVELVALKVDVLLTVSTPAALAAKAGNGHHPDRLHSPSVIRLELASCRAWPAPGGKRHGLLDARYRTQREAAGDTSARSRPNTSPVAMLWKRH